MPRKDLTARKEAQRAYYATPGGKAKINAANKRWRDKNKHRMKELTTKWRHSQKDYYRNKTRQRVYNPTRPEPERCEACGVIFSELKKGSICDHNHATGKFRGWLCHGCNVALGFAGDNIHRLNGLIDYLLRS